MPDLSSSPNIGSTAANPRAPQPNPKDSNLPQEPTGPVASDSLAAESLQSEGAFANNDNAQAMGVKGASSTLNNTDTSAAAELEPARDSSVREGDEKLKYPEGAGKATFPGHHSRDGYVGGPSADRTSTSGEYSTGQASSTGEAGHTSGEDYRANAAVDTAPNAFGKFQAEGTFKPKGANLTEGGVPQTKTFTGDVGGPHDPGRVAEEKMLSANADTTAAGAGGQRQYETGRTTGEFDVLSEERA
jgi:hypothetical protein